MALEVYITLGLVLENSHTVSLCILILILILIESLRSGACFRKKVQETNSESTNSESRNFQFSVSEQVFRVGSINPEYIDLMSQATFLADLPFTL